jgi:hypothetical protein
MGAASWHWNLPYGANPVCLPGFWGTVRWALRDPVFPDGRVLEAARRKANVTHPRVRANLPSQKRGPQKRESVLRTRLSVGGDARRIVI